MAIRIPHSPPATGDTERPVPRWAARLAYALPLLLLPSCLWRLPFAFHFEMGQLNEAGMPPLPISVPYVFGLSVLSEAAALLCLGLVRGWGEVAPRWIPLVGGRRVRPMAAVVPGVLGGTVLSFVTVQSALIWFGPLEPARYENGWWQALAGIATFPLSLWGPAVLALTAAYHVRRRGTKPLKIANDDREA